MAKHIAIATTPLLVEWRPIWSDIRLRIPGPVELAAMCNHDNNLGPEKGCNIPLAFLGICSPLSRIGIKGIL